MKHTLSPIVEYALVAMVAVYGLFGIYLSSLRPFAVATTSPSTSIDQPIPLDPDVWMRHDNRIYGYAFAAPPGWTVDDRDPARVRIARSAKELASAGSEGEGLVIERVLLYEGKAVEDAVAAEFAGRRPALYDVSVDGHQAVFAIDFEKGLVRRQAVYVLTDDGGALAVRSARMEPAAFAVFMSTLRFYSTADVTPAP